MLVLKVAGSAAVQVGVQKAERVMGRGLTWVMCGLLWSLVRVDVQQQWWALWMVVVVVVEE